MQGQEQTMQKVADAAAGAAVTVVGITWITQLSVVLQLVATVVAIVAGAFAARYHWLKAKQVQVTLYDPDKE